MPLDAKVLIGWMERDQAIRYLTRDCHNNPPLTDDQAEALWTPYRARVMALAERPRQEPARQELSTSERNHAQNFLEQVRPLNRDVSSIIKVDLMEAAVYQLYVLTDRSANYHSEVCDWKGWRKNCLRPKARTGEIPTRIEPPNVVVFELPHAEFLAAVTQTPRGPELDIHERPKWITVTPHDGRLLLWAGYHRSHARMALDDPAIGERAVPVVLVKNLVGPANTAAVTVAT